MTNRQPPTIVEKMRESAHPGEVFAEIEQVCVRHGWRLRSAEIDCLKARHADVGATYRGFTYDRPSG